MVTILNLKNLTVEVYPLLLLCKQIFSQLKTKNFSMVSWCIHLRSSLDISYFIFSFFFSWSSHLIHIRSSWSCCVSFPPHSVILYFILVLKIKFPILFGSRTKYQYCSDRRNANTFPCSGSNKNIWKQKKSPYNPGTLPNIKTNKIHFWEWLYSARSSFGEKSVGRGVDHGYALPPIQTSPSFASPSPSPCLAGLPCKRQSLAGCKSSGFEYCQDSLKTVRTVSILSRRFQ